MEIQEIAFCTHYMCLQATRMQIWCMYFSGG